MTGSLLKKVRNSSLYAWYNLRISFEPEPPLRRL
nr:MAG TPA: hypothetical protein [Caudoviricetes sp.]